MTLLLADRVDVWESRLRRHPILGGLIVAAVLSYTRARRARQSKGRRLISRFV